MKMYDIKIGKKSGEKTFWRTIGTVFGGDNAKLIGDNGKPLTFTIDYPETRGIIVPRKSKEDYEAERAMHEKNSTGNANNNDNSSTDYGDDLPI